MSTTAATKEILLADIMADQGVIDAGIKKTEAAAVLDAALAAVTARLTENGQDVLLSGVGSLRVKRSPARTSRNPRTGEPIEIAARDVVRFSPSKSLKDGLAARGD
jgi:DNA-binding protein HU-beta